MPCKDLAFRQGARPSKMGALMCGEFLLRLATLHQFSWPSLLSGRRTLQRQGKWYR